MESKFRPLYNIAPTVNQMTVIWPIHTVVKGRHLIWWGQHLFSIWGVLQTFLMAESRGTSLMWLYLKKNSNFGQGKKNDEHTSLMWLQYFSRIFKESTGHLGIQSQGI